MSNSAVPTRKIAESDFPVIFALNYAALMCGTIRRHEDADFIVQNALLYYGRLPPFLLALYANRVAAGNLDAPGSLQAFDDVFTPLEAANPFNRLVRLAVVIEGLSALPGYGRQVAAATEELRALSADPHGAPVVQRRAATLLAKAEQVLNPVG